MPRLMSVTLTEQAVVERRKTVTRRLGWSALRPGDELDLCRKVMGRKRRDGSVEPLVRLCRVRVVSVGQERLDAITDRDVAREGLTAADLSDHVELKRLVGWSCTCSGVVRDPAYTVANCAEHWHTVQGALAAAFVRFFCANMRCTPDTLVNRIEWEYLDA